MAATAFKTYKVIHSAATTIADSVYYKRIGTGAGPEDDWFKIVVTDGGGNPRNAAVYADTDAVSAVEFAAPVFTTNIIGMLVGKAGASAGMGRALLVGNGLTLTAQGDEWIINVSAAATGLTSFYISEDESNGLLQHKITAGGTGGTFVSSPSVFNTSGSYIDFRIAPIDERFAMLGDRDLTAGLSVPYQRAIQSGTALTTVGNLNGGDILMDGFAYSESAINNYVSLVGSVSRTNNVSVWSKQLLMEASQFKSSSVLLGGSNLDIISFQDQLGSYAFLGERGGTGTSAVTARFIQAGLAKKAIAPAQRGDIYFEATTDASSVGRLLFRESNSAGLSKQVILDSSQFEVTDGANDQTLSIKSTVVPNNGTLAVTTSTSAVTGTVLAMNVGTGFSANTSGNYTYDIEYGPSLTALAAIMTGASLGLLRKTAQDVYVLDSANYLTSSGAVTSFSGGTTGLLPSISSVGDVILTGTLIAANGGTGHSSYAVGDLLYASGATTLSKLPDVDTGNVLLSGGVGTAPFYGKVQLSASTHVDGVLPIARGGTATGTIPGNGQILIGNGSTYTVANITGSAGITVTNGSGSIDVSLTAQYSSDWKESVRAATTINITLSGTQTIDNVALVAGNRVLVKNQTTASANGIYVVASGAWTRAEDFNTSAEVSPGNTMTVEEGTLHADSIFQLTNNGTIILGTTALVFTKVASASAFFDAGVGLMVDTSGAAAAVTFARPGTSTPVTVNTAYDGIYYENDAIKLALGTHMRINGSNQLTLGYAEKSVLIGAGVSSDATLATFTATTVNEYQFLGANVTVGIKSFSIANFIWNSNELNIAWADAQW